jgi:hypothetical protein
LFLQNDSPVNFRAAVATSLLNHDCYYDMKQNIPELDETDVFVNNRFLLAFVFRSGLLQSVVDTSLFKDIAPTHLMAAFFMVCVYRSANGLYMNGANFEWHKAVKEQLAVFQHEDSPLPDFFEILTEEEVSVLEPAYEIL